MARKKSKVLHQRPPIQRQLPLHRDGEYFNLQKIFNRLNSKYFANSLRGYVIQWGRRRRLPPKEYFIFATIQEETRTIRVHPLLDQAFVPLWFLEYVIYHEMLHSVVPDQFDSAGRRIVHHDGFSKRERNFPSYRRAKKWETENLSRFLR